MAEAEIARMRGMTVFCLGLLLAAGPAAAADFTGFYAGVNAGWAFERGRDGHASLPPGAERTENGLPPRVARIEQSRRPGTPPAGRGR